jgi:hypothetical protein
MIRRWAAPAGGCYFCKNYSQLISSFADLTKVEMRKNGEGGLHFSLLVERLMGREGASENK